MITISTKQILGLAESNEPLSYNIYIHIFIHMAADNKGRVIFMNFSKVFDYVWHKDFSAKLGLHSLLISLIGSYLRVYNRPFWLSLCHWPGVCILPLTCVYSSSSLLPKFILTPLQTMILPTLFV